MLFGVCKGPTYEKADEALGKMQQHVDGVELRLDLFTEVNLPKLKQLLKNWNKKVLFTFRKKSQGGGFEGSVEEQQELWKKLLATIEPDFVDLEYDAPKALYELIHKNHSKVQIISSYHDFEKTPGDLEELIEKMKNPHASIYKIATKANSSLDALKMLFWVKETAFRNQKVIGLCMGEEGKITRILSPIVDNFINYVAEEDEATAPGQLSLEELFGTYHYLDLNKDTKVFAVIGYPVDKSPGPVTHNAVMKQLHRNAVYVRIPLKKEELSVFFHYVKKLAIFGGLSVTMPLKEEVLPFLDSIDPEAKTIGAVNTIIYEQQRATGYNADGYGAIKALEQKIPLSNKKVIVIGAGGAAKAIVFAALQKKAQVIVLNRTEQKAKNLAQHFRCEAGSLSKLRELAKQGYDVIINTTPDPMPIEEGDIFPGSVAMDIKVWPKMTLFLQKAQEKDCALVYGYEMFMFQAVVQQNLWFKSSDQSSNIEQIIREAILTQLRL